MEQLETSNDLIKRFHLTSSEVGVAEQAARLIRTYRLRERGTWSGPTADTLVRAEVKDLHRQIHVLSLASLLDRESGA